MTEQTIIDLVVANSQREEVLKVRLERAEIERDILEIDLCNSESCVKTWKDLYHRVSDAHAALLDNREYKNVERVTIGGLNMTVQL